MRRGVQGPWCLVWLLLIPLLFQSGCSTSSYRKEVQQDLQLRAQERIFRKAKAEYRQGRHFKTISLLQHFFGIHSRSPLETEARWLLARSYANTGNFQSALDQYEVIARALPPGESKHEALERIAELELNLSGRKKGGDHLPAVRISLSHYASIQDVEASLKRIAQEKVGSVLIDFGCRPQLKRKVKVEVAGRSVSTTNTLIYDRLPSYIAQIHDRKLRAFVGINLRCLGNWAPNSNAAWIDRVFDPVTQRVQASSHFDLSNPQYQEFLVRFLLKFVASDADGIVFLADVPSGLYEGFTSSSMEAFHQAFQVRPNPGSFFVNGQANQTKTKSNIRNQNTSRSLAPEFWRWAGWKTRKRLAVLQHLMDQVHKQKSDLHFGLEVHVDSLEDPLRALAMYGEDLLEANQLSFDFFFMNLQPNFNGQSPPSQFNTNKNVHRSRTLVDRMVVLTKDSSKVWVTPWPAKTLPTGVGGSEELGLLQGVVAVYNYQSLP